MLSDIRIVGFAADLWAENELELTVKSDEIAVEGLVKFR